MTTYIFHALYLVACSILPERKHRRCFEGSRTERIGRVIRTRCNAIRSGTFAGPYRFLLADQAAEISLSYIVKLFVIAGNQLLPGNHKNTEIILNRYKIEVDLPLVTDHTLKSVKNSVKRVNNNMKVYQKII